MPPRLSHRLSGVTEEPRRLTLHERRRQIRKGIYPPYKPLYALLKGRSIPHLARQIGIVPPRLRDILCGFYEPWFFTGVRLAKALGITTDELDRYIQRVSQSPLH